MRRAAMISTMRCSQLAYYGRQLAGISLGFAPDPDQNPEPAPLTPPRQRSGDFAPSPTRQDTGLADRPAEDGAIFIAAADDGTIYPQPKEGALVVLSPATAILLKAIAIETGRDEQNLAGVVAWLAQGFAEHRMPALARAQADHDRDLLEPRRRRRGSRAPP